LPQTGSALSVFRPFMDVRHSAEISRRLISKKTFLRFLSAFHVFVFRLTRGRLGGRLANLPVLLLTTRGRKSGKRRTVPLCYLPVPSPGGRDPLYAIVGSYGGSPVAPAWYKNLQATSVAEIEVKERRLAVLARDADEPTRARLWDDFVECYPGYEVYQAATTRKIPIVLLEAY
jgi:deazaflavin-dependent oxidoreductase (nitroreductase family)